MDADSTRSTSDLVDIVEALVAVPSTSADHAQCARMLDVVRALVGWPSARDSGLHVHEVEEEGVRSLVFATTPERRARIVLNAHVDVVPGRPDQYAVRRLDGRLEGRGVYDMKGAAAVYVRLLRDVAAMAAERRPDLQVQFVTDEEIGGSRGSEVLLRQGFSGDVFIAGEPTDLGICHRAKGILWLTARVKGRPGHAAMPWLSENPVPLLLAGLARVQERWPVPSEMVWRTTASLTGLRAGEAMNRVPEAAEADIDIRWIPDDSPDEISSFVRGAFPSGEVELKQLGKTLDTSADDAWIARLSALQQSLLGHAPRLYGEHYGSDARFYSAAGVPAFCWGPRGGGMHADDEWLDLASLLDYERVLRALVIGP